MTRSEYDDLCNICFCFYSDHTSCEYKTIYYSIEVDLSICNCELLVICNDLLLVMEELK